MCENCKKNPLCEEKSVNAIVTSLSRIAEDKRWVGHCKSEGFTNKANHALRGFIALLLIIYLENQGRVVKKYYVAKGIIKSSVKKALGEISKESQPLVFFKLVIRHAKEFMQMLAFTSFRKQAGPNPAKELFLRNGDLESFIVEVSGVLAAYIEIFELKDEFETEYYAKKEREIIQSLEKYEKDDLLAGAIDQIKKLRKEIVKIAKALRVQYRWKNQLAPSNCSVLAHLYDTAVIAYLNELELSNNKEEAGKCFFMGILHDLAEYLAGDTPSPLKDIKLLDIIESYFYKYDIELPEGNEKFFLEIGKEPIEKRIEKIRETFKKYIGTVPVEVEPILNLMEEGKTLRDGAEYAEEYLLEEKFYPLLPQYMEKPLKALNFEAPGNENYFAVIKTADYLAAILECYYQYDKGSNNWYFQRATNSTIEGIKSGKYVAGPNLEKVFEAIQKDCELLLESARNQTEVEALKQKISELEGIIECFQKEIDQLKKAIKN